MSEEKEMEMPLIEALVFCKKNPEYGLKSIFVDYYYLVDEWIGMYGKQSIKEIFYLNETCTVRKRQPEHHKEVKQVLEKYLRPPCKIDEALELLKPYLKGE